MTDRLYTPLVPKYRFVYRPLILGSAARSNFETIAADPAAVLAIPKKIRTKDPNQGCGLSDRLSPTPLERLSRSFFNCIEASLKSRTEDLLAISAADMARSD